MFVTSLLLSLRHPPTHSECVYMHSTRPSPVSCRSERWKKRENGKNSWKLTLKRSTMKTKVCRAPPGGKCAVEQRWGLEKRMCVQISKHVWLLKNLRLQGFLHDCSLNLQFRIKYFTTVLSLKSVPFYGSQ